MGEVGVNKSMMLKPNFTAFKAELYCEDCKEYITLTDDSTSWQKHLNAKHKPKIKRLVPVPKVTPKILAESRLLQLIEEAQWYQPTSNSGPSCPWCLNMQHWGHDENCIVVELGIADNSGYEELG